MRKYIIARIIGVRAGGAVGLQPSHKDSGKKIRAVAKFLAAANKLKKSRFMVKANKNTI